MQPWGVRVKYTSTKPQQTNLVVTNHSFLIAFIAFRHFRKEERTLIGVITAWPLEYVAIVSICWQIHCYMYRCDICWFVKQLCSFQKPEHRHHTAFWEFHIDCEMWRLCLFLLYTICISMQWKNSFFTLCWILSCWISFFHVYRTVWPLICSKLSQEKI